jgi:hypothetical protein
VSQGKWMPTVVLWLVCFGNALAYICSLAEQWMPCWPCFWKSQWAWSKVGHIYIYCVEKVFMVEFPVGPPALAISFESKFKCM